MVIDLNAPRVAQSRYAKGGRLRPWALAADPRPLQHNTRRDPIVPLVSSGVAGPLALVHLPRMWLEGMSDATGRLDGAFAGGRPLFDEILCDGIALDRSAFRTFLRTAPVPSYLACEAWVSEHALRLDGASIAQVNNAIRKAGVSDGTPLVLADDLRAWRAVYDRVCAGETQCDPIVPLISSRTAGGLGVDHLPRVWLKNVLKKCGALPFGYRAGPVRIVARGLAGVPGGLDAETYAAIGLDMSASVAHIESALPDYPAYEAWVRRNARTLDAASVTRHNATRDDTRDVKAVAEKAYAGYTGPSNWSYLIDDLIDWKLLHQIVTDEPLPDWTCP
jgi:hypothetical protein